MVMITAYGDAETKRKALANGADAFLTKPIGLRLSGAKSMCASDTPHDRSYPGLLMTTPGPGSPLNQELHTYCQAQAALHRINLVQGRCGSCVTSNAGPHGDA